MSEHLNTEDKAPRKTTSTGATKSAAKSGRYVVDPSIIIER